jgi:beta-lactam-binding protein with PASTA domain
VRVPDLFGLTFDQASQVLDTFGFQTKIGNSGDFKPHDRVRFQSPEADTKAQRGSSVTIGR